VGECAQLLDKGLRSGDHSSLALHRLKHDRHCLTVDGLLHRLNIVEGHLDKTGYLGFEQLLPSCLAGRRHGGEGAAVEAVVKGDYLVGAFALQRAPLACQFDGPFVGLSATVGKENMVKGTVLRQQAGQLQHGLIVEGGAWIDQCCALLLQCTDNRRMTVAKTIDGPALDKVQVLPAMAIRQPRPASAGKDNIRAHRNRHDGIVKRIHGWAS